MEKDNPDINNLEPQNETAQELSANNRLTDDLTHKQKTFLDAYLEYGSQAEALRHSAYTGKNSSITASRFLKTQKAQSYLEKRGKIVEERLNSQAILLGINKESILTKAWDIVNKVDTKNADRIQSLALISKILGICKPETVNNLTFMQELIQTSNQEPIQYKKPIVISPCDTTSNES